jgi:alpha-galactosidase
MVAAFARKIVKQYGFNTKIESTTKRREALAGANYVIVTISVGGSKWTHPNRKIALKYGVNEGVGDTLGPGGVFYAARHVPPILDICHDMEELCPSAWLLNYTNPMAIISWEVSDYTHIKNVGLCHSVQGTASELARYMGIPINELTYWVAGINHMAWFLKLQWHGKDVYPILREKFKDTAIYSASNAHWAGPDMVRAEIFKAFGYFNTESSVHMSEYTPYFRKRPELFEKYKLKYLFDDDWIKKRREEDEEFKQLINLDQKFTINHSGEYGSIIINSIETGKPSRINGNVKNKNLITNLPYGCCVEVPCLVDKEGIHPCYVGDLPPQLAALNRTNINVQELAVRGIVEKDKTKIFQSILLDPLTGALLTIEETREMVDEIFQAEKEYLKDYK